MRRNCSHGIPGWSLHDEIRIGQRSFLQCWSLFAWSSLRYLLHPSPFLAKPTVSGYLSSSGSTARSDTQYPDTLSPTWFLVRLRPRNTRAPVLSSLCPDVFASSRSLLSDGPGTSTVSRRLSRFSLTISITRMTEWPRSLEIPPR